MARPIKHGMRRLGAEDLDRAAAGRERLVDLRQDAAIPRSPVPSTLSVRCTCGWGYTGHPDEALAQNRAHRAEHADTS